MISIPALGSIPTAPINLGVYLTQGAAVAGQPVSRFLTRNEGSTFGLSECL